MKYIAKGEKVNVTMRVEFADGILESITFAEASRPQIDWILKRMPSGENELIDFCKTAKLRLSEVPVDLSFEAFWNAYKRKVGKLKRTQRLWETMTDLQKQTVLTVIPRYHRFLAHENTSISYAETFLANEMWNNDYRLK